MNEKCGMRAGRLSTGVLIASATAMGAVTASAADLPSKTPAAPAIPALTSVDWSGFYLGGHIGWGRALSRGTYDDGADILPIDFGGDGFLYGALGGYNWQAGRLVYGIEIDGTWGELDTSRIDFDRDQQRIKTNTLASARFRSGAAIDNVYLFGSIGIGYAHSKFTVTGDLPNPASRDIDGWGLASGLGIEYAITPNWSLRGEYLYYAISAREGLSNLTTDSEAADFAKVDGIHVARVAASYRFNGSQAARGFAYASAPAMDWSGFYVGAHGGYGGSRIVGVYDEAGDSGSFDLEPTGIAGGLQAGYNIQRGAWVFGIEADGTWADVSDERTDIEGDTQELKTSAFASVRGRIGVAADNRLYYITAGWGLVKSKLSVFEPNTSASTSFTSHGVVIGSGVDWAFNPNWSVRLEGLTYLTDNRKSIPALTFDSDRQDFVRQDLAAVIRVGVNYRFGGPN
jgi:outer membrane immunogenic protein